MKKYNKIIAIQGDAIEKINRKTFWKEVDSSTYRRVLVS